MSAERPDRASEFSKAVCEALEVVRKIAMRWFGRIEVRSLGVKESTQQVVSLSGFRLRKVQVHAVRNHVPMLRIGSNALKYSPLPDHSANTGSLSRTTVRAESIAPTFDLKFSML